MDSSRYGVALGFSVGSEDTMFRGMLMLRMTRSVVVVHSRY